jgi:hypothetical protein
LKCRLVAAGMLALALQSVGCAYYKVTDPSLGKTYYTDNWHSGRHGGSGAVRFLDIGSGQEVTLQNSELKVVTRDEVRTPTGK